eukprot:4551090-Alexandrium_andersonii.AAC.1
MAVLALCRPTKVLTNMETLSMKAGVGARLAENATTMTGPKARRHREGLMGPPRLTPVRTGRRTRLPFGRAKVACQAKMNDVI